MTNDSAVTGVRHIVLEGAANARDIGGFAGDGGTVRWGAVYRTDSLCNLTDTDVARLAELNLAVAIDFRDQSEVDQSGSDHLPAGTVPEHIAIIDFAGSSAMMGAMSGSSAAMSGMSGMSSAPGPEMAAALQSNLGDGGGAKIMSAVYEQFVRGARAHKGFGKAVDLVASIDADADAAALYHCHSGKDRTGWMTAILLSALGVDRDVIMADYLSSNDYLRESNEQLFAQIAAAGLDADLIRPVMEQSTAYLQASFDAVDADYGDMARYTREALGVTDATIDALRGRLLG
ncbi:tyrosine-protein phosphatase [Tomitella biformata]|uniref:tyrosine-protein phosphatase n=1 Tax=Tomitella biformata TaxID=630403 RepID=UPI0004676FA6|nr:tyrosine-protein phosphatase [Tomitella biformata]